MVSLLIAAWFRLRARVLADVTLREKLNMIVILTGQQDDPENGRVGSPPPAAPLAGRRHGRAGGVPWEAAREVAEKP